MEILMKADDRTVFDKLLEDEIVSRASIIMKEGKGLGKEGYYCYVSGTEEQCERALEIGKENGAEEVTEKEKEEIVKKIKEEEEKAMEGFGGIFG